MELSDLDQYCQTRTLTEKLYDIFANKAALPLAWEEYLDSLDGVEHIRKFSALHESFEYLIEVINQEPFSRMIISDPVSQRNFIIIDRDFANMVLALGELP